MEAHPTVGRIPECTTVVARNRAAAAGVMLVVGLASSLAVGFGAVVERLTTTDTLAPALVADVNQETLRPATARFGDPWYDALQLESGRSLRHVVDRWYDDRDR